ncbi:hypothetical protein SAMN05446934_9375 [Paraburkholderia hospita]|jgi:hypothetical protein|nr:hypothetical protein PMI06_008917 [Burkholderia sp. BT03]SKC54278.1 hypothetical protein SAMN06266956_0668 [Paraburkholderia hospita]SKD04604.1 hypothetical protein SAMN05446934_9375 [Paraburkholderia hospita]
MLADFIDANVETLAADWVDQAQRLGATTLSASALDVSGRRLLKSLAQDMRTAQNVALSGCHFSVSPRQTDRSCPRA